MLLGAGLGRELALTCGSRQSGAGRPWVMLRPEYSCWPHLCAACLPLQKLLPTLNLPGRCSPARPQVQSVSLESSDAASLNHSVDMAGACGAAAEILGLPHSDAAQVPWAAVFLASRWQGQLR